MGLLPLPRRKIGSTKAAHFCLSSSLKKVFSLLFPHCVIWSINIGSVPISLSCFPNRNICKIIIMKSFMRKFSAFQGMFLLYFLLSVLLPQYDCHADNYLHGIGHIHHVSTHASPIDCCNIHTNNHSHDKGHLHFLTEDSNITRIQNSLWKSDSKQTADYSTSCASIIYEFARFTVHTEGEHVQQRFKRSFSGLSPPVF